MAKTMKSTKDKNIEINAERLDADVREAAGDFYNRSSISNFVMGKANNYYNMMVNRGRVSKIALKKLCSKYKLDPSDYIIVRPKLEVVKIDHVPVPTDLPTVKEDPEIEVVVEKEESEVKPSVDLVPTNNKIDEVILQIEILVETVTKLIDVVGTCFAESKSTNFLISQLTDKVSQNNKMQKEVLDKLEQHTRYKKNNGNNNRHIG